MSEAAGLQLAETATPAPEPVENEPHIDILRRDVNEWNRWRSVNPELKPQLEGVKCTHADLQKANLSNANLREADLSNSDLSGADLANADLTGASLGGTKFEGADLRDADFSGAELEWFLVEAANLRGANLQGIDFGKASVAGTNLHDTDLRNADLRLVTGLQANQLAGADLSAAKLPQGFDSTEGLSNVEESSKNPRKLFLLMLLVCAYALLTAFTTTDAGLVTNSGTSPLPIIGARIPIVGFYWCSPVLLLGVYVYFHLYSQRLWEALFGWQHAASVSPPGGLCRSPSSVCGFAS